MIIYILILGLIIAVIMLFKRVRKLEKTTPKVQEIFDGSYSLIYKDKEIYNAKPSEK